HHFAATTGQYGDQNCNSYTDILENRAPTPHNLNAANQLCQTGFCSQNKRPDQVLHLCHKYWQQIITARFAANRQESGVDTLLLLLAGAVAVAQLLHAKSV